MKTILPIIFLVTIFLLGSPEACYSQCSILENPVPGISLEISVGGTQNRSSVAFHPIFDLYYSVNAGSPGYPMDVYDTDGNLIDSVAQGFDYRGLWYNPLNGQLEGNGFSDLGLFNQSLNLITGIPNGTGNVIFESNQPDAQSCGTLDTERNEIVYYSGGEIYRYDREDGSFVSSHDIVGLPNELENLNATSIVYTGCSNLDFGVLDAVNRQLYLCSGTNFIVNAIVELPMDAPLASSFRLAYANDLLWLYDDVLLQWQSYSIFDNALSSSIESEAVTLLPFPNPASDVLNISISEALFGAEMSITDIQGRVVRSWKQSKTDSESIDISTLPSGTFVLSFTGNYSSGSTRFVKE